MPDELDRQMLKALEQGRELRPWSEEIGQPWSTSRRRAQQYRKLGILSDGNQVDWAKFEANPSLPRGSSGKKTTVDKAIRETQSDTKSEIQATQRSTSRATQETQRDTLTSGEIVALRALLARIQAPQVSRTGETVHASFRLNKALLEALKAQSQAEGITMTEAITRAVEAYLKEFG